MIWDVQSNKEITRIPHKREYDTWISRLTHDEVQRIRAEIRRRIAGDEIATAGWIPGSDWSGTPFHQIYEIACHQNEESAGKFFGLLVWTTLMEHEDRWGFGKYEFNNLQIASMTYFKV